MYIDAFVVPVKKTKLKAYTAHAKAWAKVWLKYGALSVVEAAADDVKPGKVTSYPQSVKLKKDETIVVSYICFKSRKARDACMKKAMRDPLMAQMDPKDWPFDGQRMFFGGFKSIVDVAAK
jgi:uncharacterized protein YbaA (DUF1428 family)